MKYLLFWTLVFFSVSEAQETIPPLLKDMVHVQVTSDSTNLRGTLTLPQALQQAMRHNPQLASFSLEIRVREAAALQASLFPNPELDVEVENFAGSGPLASFNAMETTISVGQLIELAGKRDKRKRVAILDKDLALVTFRARQLDVFVQTVSAFNKVLAGQELVKLNRELLKLARAFKKNIAHRVQAGRLSPAELSRAEVEVARARLALQRRQKELRAARLELAAVWGSKKAAFLKVNGTLEAVFKVPALAKLKKLMEQNPDVIRWEVVAKQRQALQRLARAQRIPDPFVRMGWRTFNESGDRAFIAGLSIPLPLFNRNQGAIQEASIRLKQSELQKRALLVQLQTQLYRSYQMLLAAYESIRTLKETIIPQAEEAFQTIGAGYRQGKFGFLDVLEAQRTLFASREAYLQNLTDYQLIRARIERLIGQSLTSVQ